MIQNQLLENRFLLSLNRQETMGKLDEKVLAICEQMDLPNHFLKEFKQLLPDSNHIYYGFEENEKRCLCKVYLEFRDRIEKEIKGIDTGEKSFLLFLGFKWDMSDSGKQAASQYFWFPSLPVQDIVARIASMFDHAGDRGSLIIMEDMIKKASQKISPQDIQYVEVFEEGNPRRSFDINLYKAGLPLEDLHLFLFKVADDYSLPSEDFRLLYDRIKSERFGHLGGGVDREGRNYLTVYYGVEHLYGCHLKPGPAASDRSFFLYG
jgi:hypothetical protein